MPIEREVLEKGFITKKKTQKNIMRAKILCEGFLGDPTQWAQER